MRGLDLVLDQATHAVTGPCKVHLRSYKRRRNNPAETLIDLKNQALINAAVPPSCEQLHYTLQAGVIRAVPVPNRTFHIRQSTRNEEVHQALIALSAGVDGSIISREGFALKALIEWRPPEKRDGRQDLSETGAFAAMCNGAYELVYNEDMRSIDWARVASDLEHKPVSLAAISLCCFDHSNLKSARLRERQAAEGITASRDLVYDALRLIETAQPATILVETVPGFMSSFEAVLLRTKLKQWGYFVHESVLDPRSHGALTSRRRYYLVGTVWPGYTWPTASGLNGTPLAEILGDSIEGCRDVTDLKTVQQARTSRYGRITPLSKTYAPTIVRSQARQAKDAVYFEKDGRILMPTEQVLLKLQGIENYDLSMVSGEVGTEIIGQSVDGPLHRALVASIHQHIEMQRTMTCRN